MGYYLDVQQDRTARRLRACFGEEYLADKTECAMRLLEEVAEAAQVAGVPYGKARIVLSRAFARPVGEIGQELAGTAVTLLALAESCGLKLSIALENELQRIETTDPEHFQQRQPSRSVLGGTN
jgi:hypothetical protein